MFHPETQHFEIVTYSRWEEDLDVCIEAGGNIWIPAADASLQLLGSTDTARLAIGKGADFQCEKRRNQHGRASFVVGGRRFDRPFNGDGPQTAAVMLAALGG